MGHAVGQEKASRATFSRRVKLGIQKVVYGVLVAMHTWLEAIWREGEGGGLLKTGESQSCNV